ncbi:hypothetical protein FACS1894104_0170 [Actinomycetota bacterium]|nr:hypothetical protein FACS1894104_0170 [Actinomycetota bacterium]
MTNEMWITKAAFFEALALGFLYPNQTLIDALASGEYAEALDEISTFLEIDGEDVLQAITDLAAYKGQDKDQLLHQLRREHTRLFIGSPESEVSPYAGVWYAQEQGVQPLLFVNKESMAVERFMRQCGVGQPEGTNEPLDHIGSELEFLQYLALIKAQAVTPPADISIPSDAYEQFYQDHITNWVPDFAQKTIQTTKTPFFSAISRLLLAYVK